MMTMLVAALGAAAQQRSWTADNGNGTYTNPLFYDEFSDPDILRVGDDYYLAGTTMHTVPGLVILHSKDLVNWENISYCFDRFDFDDDAFSLKNHQEIYGQGVWAPAIRYANGQFYVFTNINGKGLQCYTSKDIRGPWQHHNMQGNIYDLSVLFDDDGKIYAIHKYGEVHCTELKPDMSGPVEGTDRVIIQRATLLARATISIRSMGCTISFLPTTCPMAVPFVPVQRASGALTRLLPSQLTKLSATIRHLSPRFLVMRNTALVKTAPSLAFPRLTRMPRPVPTFIRVASWRIRTGSGGPC